MTYKHIQQKEGVFLVVLVWFLVLFVPRFPPPPNLLWQDVAGSKTMSVFTKGLDNLLEDGPTGSLPNMSV